MLVANSITSATESIDDFAAVSTAVSTLITHLDATPTTFIYSPGTEEPLGYLDAAAQAFWPLGSPFPSLECA